MESLTEGPVPEVLGDMDPETFHRSAIGIADWIRHYLNTPEYLETSEADSVRNFMDTGIALGRRFRALKLWMVLRYFGAQGIRARLAEHVRLARLFAAWVDGNSDFERLAPTTLSVVCFRAAPASVPPERLNELNATILNRVNASGDVYCRTPACEGVSRCG